MWHSDICHLVFAPADAFLRVNQKAGKVTLCTQCGFHTFHLRAYSSLFLSVFFLIGIGECLSKQQLKLLEQDEELFGVRLLGI